MNKLNGGADKKFRGVWLRAKAGGLPAMTPESVCQWATDAGLTNPVARFHDVGAFQKTPAIALETVEGKACFPVIPETGDARWAANRKAKEDEAALWEKMEWFLPLWLPNEAISNLLNAVTPASKQEAIDLFDYHTSTLYTMPFEAICIAQLMPQARSLKEIVPVARECYLGVYSGYKASSIAALIPAIEGSLTRIVADAFSGSSNESKVDHAIDRAIATVAELHFGGFWVPDEYKTVDYLFGQDERVLAFETFRQWLKNHFFQRTNNYNGLTWLNRHMFAHGTADSWKKPTNFTRLIVVLTTLAVIESWYDESHRISFLLPEMNDDSKLLWQQALFRAEIQVPLKLMEQERYQQNGRLVPEMPTDDGVLLRQAILSEECMNDLVRPLRDAGWSVEVAEPEAGGLYMVVKATDQSKSFKVALLYSCATDNDIYRDLAETCDAILYRGAPYEQVSFARGIKVHVGPVLGWQPPRTRDV